MSTVSVIIPNHNRASLIAETLESILSQTRVADEIIVVDDGSTDCSVDVIKQFAPRVSLITQPNAGPAAARNRGLAASRGTFIQFFDSDDLCAANKIEVQLAAIEATGADIAYGPWVKAKLADAVATCEPFVIQQKPVPGGRPPHRHFVGGWVCLFQACLVRRDLIDRIGGFDARLIPSEDSELFFRMLVSGAKLVHTPETIVVYRLHGANQISGSALDRVRRARDWALFKTIVAERMRADAAKFTALDRWLWAIDAMQADRQVSALLGERPRGLGAAAVGAIGFIDTLRRRVTRKLCGTLMDPVYGEGAMTDRQRALILELGYAARQ